MKFEKILHRVNSTCKGSEAREHVVCSRNQKFEAKAKGEGARGEHDQIACRFLARFRQSEC